MNIAKQKKKKINKICKNCGKEYVGNQFTENCSDPDCVEKRMLGYKRNKHIDVDVDNLIIPKFIVKRAIKLIPKKLIILKCRAKNNFGSVCGKKFTTILDIKRSIYPKFCDEHRNSYKRERYLLNRS